MALQNICIHPSAIREMEMYTQQQANVLVYGLNRLEADIVSYARGIAMGRPGLGNKGRDNNPQAPMDTNPKDRPNLLSVQSSGSNTYSLFSKSPVPPPLPTHNANTTTQPSKQNIHTKPGLCARERDNQGSDGNSTSSHVESETPTLTAVCPGRKDSEGRRPQQHLGSLNKTIMNTTISSSRPLGEIELHGLTVQHAAKIGKDVHLNGRGTGQSIVHGIEDHKTSYYDHGITNVLNYLNYKHKQHIYFTADQSVQIYSDDGGVMELPEKFKIDYSVGGQRFLNSSRNVGFSYNTLYYISAEGPLVSYDLEHLFQEESISDMPVEGYAEKLKGGIDFTIYNNRLFVLSPGLILEETIRNCASQSVDLKPYLHGDNYSSSPEMTALAATKTLIIGAAFDATSRTISYCLMTHSLEVLHVLISSASQATHVHLLKPLIRRHYTFIVCSHLQHSVSLLFIPDKEILELVPAKRLFEGQIAGMCVLSDSEVLLYGSSAQPKTISISSV